MAALELQERNTTDKLIIDSNFDSDKDIAFTIRSEYNVIWLSPDQINQLITHLSEQLTKIGVQVDILKKK